MCQLGAANTVVSSVLSSVVVSVRLWVILLTPLSNHTTSRSTTTSSKGPHVAACLVYQPSRLFVCAAYLSRRRVPSRLFVSARALVSSAAVLTAAPAALLGSGVVFGEGFVQALVRVSQIVFVYVRLCHRGYSRASRIKEIVQSKGPTDLCVRKF